MSDDEGRPNGAEQADQLRAQIEAARAHLAATADALASRVKEPPAAKAPPAETVPADEPAAVPAAVPADVPAKPAANLPVLYRPADHRRTVTVAGAVVGVVVLALRLRRRLRR